MFNKYKKGELVFCNGKGKISDKKFCTIGRIVEKDYYYKDYLVKFKNGTEEWFNEEDIYKL